MTPLQVWSARRPAVYGVLSRVPNDRVRAVGWRLYWSVWLRLKYWSFYPVTNPKTVYLVCLIAAAVAIAAQRGRW